MTGATELPDDNLSRALLETIFAEETEAIANHSVRSFLFAQAALEAEPSTARVSVPLLFAACILHDAGLTREGNREHRFEVDGADYASRILKRHNVGDDSVRQVWEAIALHTSPHIAERWSPLANYTRIGIGIDFGRQRSLLKPSTVTSINAAFPRHRIETALVDAIVRQTTSRPEKAPQNSFADVLLLERRHAAETRLEQSAAANGSVPDVL